MNGCQLCFSWPTYFTECSGHGSPENGDAKSKKKSAKNHLQKLLSTRRRIDNRSVGERNWQPKFRNSLEVCYRVAANDKQDRGVCCFCDSSKTAKPSRSEA